MKIGNVEVLVTDKIVSWTSGMGIDADGSPHAYAPLGSGLKALDYLANAGKPGNWYGLVTDPDSNPIIQGQKDPAPGYYVSPTALSDRTKRLHDPRCYVDSETVPYIAIPPELKKLAGVKLGDLVMVLCNGARCGAICADVGPHNKIGEGSIYLAQQLRIPPSAKNGGVSSGVSYTIFKGTSKGWPRALDDIDAQTKVLFGVS
jgi:hypothetical protein